MSEIVVVFDEERDLTENELHNLKTKKNSIPVEYFRKNLFNATTRESRELTRKKTIYEDPKNKVQVNRSLHQRHRDLLSILFTDNIKVSEPNKDGSYYIHTSLYDLSKKMGYKPLQGINKVMGFIEDLHQTLLTIDIVGVGEIRHTLIGKSFFDKYNTKEFKIEIPSITAKYHILNFAVEIPKEINRKIIAIDNKYAKTKALISYILSNKALKNGISFDNICDKLDITVSSRKSEFKKELKENIALLAEFNIFFDEETYIIKYEQLSDIKFHRGMKPIEIIELIENEKEKKLKEEEYEEYGFRKNRFVGKFIKHKSNGLFGEEIVSSKIVDIQIKLENDIKYYRFELGYDNVENVFTQWLTLERLESLEQNWITNN